MAFQRKQASTSAPFNTVDGLITLLASWTALKAASDSTKIVVTPVLDSLVIPMSEAAEEGGNDNTTPNGIPIYLGENPVNVTGLFRNLPKTTIADLRKLTCESFNGAGGPQLSVFLFTRYGKIIHAGASAGDSFGIDMYNFRLSTPGSEGYNADNKSMMGFYLPSDWDEDFVISTPSDFNPITDL